MTNKKLLIETLKENVDPTVTEKNELEYRDMLKLTATVAVIGPSAFLLKEQNRSISSVKSSASSELSIDFLVQKVKQVVLEKYEFENRDLLVIIAFLTLSASQDAHTKNVDVFFFIEKTYKQKAAD